MEIKGHIPRLFVMYGDLPKLDHHGLPTFSTGSAAALPQAFWEKWQTEQCIVLLGEPGIGKSTEFEFQHKALRGAGEYCFLIRLKDFHFGCGLDDLIGPDEVDGWKNWKKDHAAKGFLFLDSLDEARLDYEAALKQIITQVRSALLISRLQMRLSCRVRDWKSISDRSLLDRMFRDKVAVYEVRQEGVAVIELLPLHHGGIYAITQNAGVDPDGFISKAEEHRILHLCSHPLLLEFLLNEYEEKAELASTRTEVYSKAIDRLLLEENPVHGEARKASDPRHRRYIASKLAAISVLSGYDSLHVPDIDNPALPCIDSCLSGETKNILLETFNTKAFTSSRPGEFRFFHRTVAEFLAAEFLRDQIADDMTFLHLCPLLFAANQGVPTPLRGTVSWLAGLSKRAREECLKYDPLVVLEGDLSAYDRHSKEFIIKYLAQRFRGRKWQREVTSYGELASGVDSSLLIDLIGKHHAEAVRTMLLHMISEGRLEPVPDRLLEIMFDDTDDEIIRVISAMILAEQGSEEQKKVLKVFLARSGNSDFEDEMTGAILSGLFPQFLTVEEALNSLHDQPAIPKHLGKYHIFWHVYFEREISNKDLETAIELLFKMIIMKDVKYWGDPQHDHLAKLFSRLLSRYLASTLAVPSKTILPWLKLLTESNIFRHASDRAALKEIEEWLKTKTAVKRELLVLHLENNPPSDTHRFSLWQHLPFPQGSVTPDDFDWVVQLLEQDSDDWRKHAFFQLATFAWSRGNYLPTIRITELIRLSEQCAPCNEEWQQWRSCPLEYDKWKSKEKQFEENSRIQREKNRSLAQGNMRLIEEGDLGWLCSFSDLMTDKDAELFGPPDFSILEKEYGSDIRNAAEKGYARAWQNASIQISGERWKSNQIPRYDVLISQTLEGQWQKGRIDWTGALLEQVQAAAYVAIKHYGLLPEWFVRLYRERRDPVEEFFDKILDIEAKSKLEHLELCGKILYSKNLNQEFQEYLLSHPLPANQLALDCLRASSLRSRGTGLNQIVAKHAVDLWKAIDTPSSEQPLRAMSLLVAWWYVDWQTAWQFVTQEVFVGGDRIRNILSFAGAMMRIPGEPGFSLKSWPADMPLDAAIAIVPYLYEAIPPSADTRGFDGERQRLRWFRDGVLKVVQSGEPQKAKKAFAAWVADPLFIEHKDAFLSIQGELDRRIIDEQWQPASPSFVAEVIFHGANLIRNQSDLFTLLIDMLDIEMRAVLLNDTSLVPFLWEGAKKAGRSPKDEKPLQALLANQLSLLLKGRPTVFSREPEVFDAKKPDFLVSASISDLGSVHVPVEVKQAHAADVWSSPIGQLFEKYMKEPSINSGLYLVGWYGPSYPSPVHPETKERFTNPNEFQEALQTHTDTALADKGKKIAVFVYDVKVA